MLNITLRPKKNQCYTWILRCCPPLESLSLADPVTSLLLFHQVIVGYGLPFQKKKILYPFRPRGEIFLESLISFKFSIASGQTLKMFWAGSLNHWVLPLQMSLPLPLLLLVLPIQTWRFKRFKLCVTGSLAAQPEIYIF